MESFFVGYSYGPGGIWCYLDAPSKEAILEKYPYVGVWKRPSFFNDDLLESIRKTSSYKLEDLPEVLHEALLEASNTAVPSPDPSDC